MNHLLEQFTADPWGRLVIQYLATGGIENCLMSLLVAARLTGLLVIAPALAGTEWASLRIRVGAVMILTMIIAPTIAAQTEAGSIPISKLLPLMNLQTELPIDLMLLIAGELALGVMLGVGVAAVFSGLRLGGEWIDRHSGLDVGTVMNPDRSGGETATLRMIPLVGIAVVLLMESFGGQWLLLRTLIESFEFLPPGEAVFSGVTMGLINNLVQQSLVLGIRIAIPLVVVMLIVDFTFAFASRNGMYPALTISMAGKATMGIVVLTLTLPAIPNAIATSISSLFS